MNDTVKHKFSIKTDFFICIFIFLSIITVYWQSVHFDFVSFDDQLNVTENPHVQSGLSMDNIRWAFRFTEKGDKHYWHPLTSISHMVDCHLYGLAPKGHHITNLLIHSINSLMLYLLFRRLTRDRLKSLSVAILFALHPLNVESVVWVAERKNVLSTFFWFTTMLAYLKFVKNRSIFNYSLVFISMLLGLLCKPILVTLPCVLLLLDIWPIKRITFHSDSIRSFFSLLIEKLPLFSLSTLWIYLSSLSMQRLGVAISFDSVPLDLRMANAIVSYIKYILKVIWPFNLSIFYPYPSEMLPIWQITVSAILLLLIFYLSFQSIKNKPYFAIGWCWYIGTLFPVIGLMQNGLWPSMADRWTYIPHIGIFIIIVWGLTDIYSKFFFQKKIAITVAVFIFSILIITTWKQIQYWKNDLTLFKHAIDVTSENAIAHNNLAGALIKQKKIEEGIAHYHNAINFYPGFKQAYFNLGKILAEEKKYMEAEKYIKKSILIDPSFEDAYHNLGAVLMMEGKHEQAIESFSYALTLNPELALSHYNLGILFANSGKINESIHHFSQAIRIKPDFTEARNKRNHIINIRDNIEKKIKTLSEQLAFNPQDAFQHFEISMLFKKMNKLDNAIDHLNQAITIKPDYIRAINQLAQIQVEKKQYQKAISTFLKLIKYMPENNSIQYNISCLYSKLNQKQQALYWLNKAIENGYENWEQISRDKDLENIRSSQEFENIISGR